MIYTYQYEDPATLEVKEERGPLEWMKHFAIRHLRMKNYIPLGIFGPNGIMVVTVNQLKEIWRGIQAKTEGGK